MSDPRGHDCPNCGVHLNRLEVTLSCGHTLGVRQGSRYVGCKTLECPKCDAADTDAALGEKP
jgi:hypothetical protein